MAATKQTQPKSTAAGTAETAPSSSKTAKKTLFDDEDDEDGAPDASNTAEASTLTVNEAYARRFEHNKKREEKQRLEEKYGTGQDDAGDDDDDDDSSEYSTEDEDGYLLTPELDAQINATIQAIRNKDPVIFDPNHRFYTVDAAAAADKKKKEAKDKPMFLRDYHREQYLKAADGGEKDDDAAAAPIKTYQQEQDELRQAVIDEMKDADGKGEGDDDDDAFLKPKRPALSATTPLDSATGAAHPSRVANIPKLTELDVKTAHQDPEGYLDKYLTSRAWAAGGSGAVGHSGTSGWTAFASDDEDEDGAELGRAQAYEAAFNLRFEDPEKSNEVLQSYSRKVVAEQTVRRDAKTVRQRQREREREERAARKQQRREERARLRKLQIEEASEKLAQIRKAAGLRGGGGQELAEEDWIKLLEGSWDNEAWAAEMQRKFDEAYYAEADPDQIDPLAAVEDEAEKGKAKPTWDDDIDIKDIVPEFEDKVPEIVLSEEEDNDNDDDDDDDDDDDAHRAKRRKVSKKEREQAAAAARSQARRDRAHIEALVDHHMAMDVDVSVSAKSHGFRYRETSPESFGLTPRDILLAPSDTALNEFAGLKKLATFRDEERKRRDRKKLGKKARLRNWRRDTFGEEFAQEGPTYGFERLLGEEAAAAEAAAGRHKSRSKGKGKDKGKNKSKDKEDKGKGRHKAEAKETKVHDGDEHTSEKKKRKRSKKSGGEKSTAEE